MTLTPTNSPATATPVESESEGLNEVEVQDFKRKAVSGTISYTLRSIFLNGISIVTSLVLGYYLLPEDFAIYGIVAQIIGILQFFSSVGLGPTLIQKKSEPTITEYRTVFTVQQLLSWGIVLAAIGVYLSGTLHFKIGLAGELVFLALALSFPLDSLRVISAIILERKLDFSKLVIPNVAEQVVYNFVLILSVVVLQKGVVSYAYAILARGIVGVIAMYMVQTWPVGLAWDRKVVRSFLSVGLQFQASDLLAKIKDQFFYLALGFWLPLQQFGYITWAKGWSQMPYNLTVQNVIAITFPAYARLQHDKHLLKKAIEKTIYFISLSIFPVLCGMAIFIIPFTTLIPQYQKWQPALFTFILFTISIGWAAISTPLTNTLSAIGQISKTVRLMIMWTSLTWTVTPICVVLFGFNGVAIAAFLISFTSIIPMYLLRTYVHVDVFSQVKHPLLAAAIMSGVCILGLPLWKLSFIHFVTGMAVGAMIYLVALLLIGRQKLMSEVQSLLNARKKVQI